MCKRLIINIFNNAIIILYFLKVTKLGVSPLKKVSLTILVPTRIISSETKIFLQIYKPTFYQSGKGFECNLDENINATSNYDELVYKKQLEDVESKDVNPVVMAGGRVEGFTEDINSKYTNENDVPHENRTFFVNCSMKEIKCAIISCIIGPFQEPSNVSLVVKMNIDLNILGEYSQSLCSINHSSFLDKLFEKHLWTRSGEKNHFTDSYLSIRISRKILS